MSRNEIDRGRTGAAPSLRLDGPALLIQAGGLSLARQLGPLPWTALQHLALASQSTDNGQAAAIGVRDIAAGIGVTKDTAARAVAALVAAGIVSRDRVEAPGVGRRSGYLLRLPADTWLVDGHNRLDAVDSRSDHRPHRNSPRRMAPCTSHPDTAGGDSSPDGTATEVIPARPRSEQRPLFEGPEQHGPTAALPRNGEGR